MATTITSKRHDTKITFKDTPTIDDVPVPPGDLAGCTLSFIMSSDTTTPPIAIKRVATINVDGTFSYDPTPTDVAVSGKYLQEWELVYPSGKILTFPNNGYNVIKLIDDKG